MAQTAAQPVIKGMDNRGDDRIMFGFVYVDDTRVKFSLNGGVQSSMGWDSTPEQRRAALAYLNRHHPGWDQED